MFDLIFIGASFIILALAFLRGFADARHPHNSRWQGKVFFSNDQPAGEQLFENLGLPNPFRMTFVRRAEGQGNAT